MERSASPPSFKMENAWSDHGENLFLFSMKRKDTFGAYAWLVVFIYMTGIESPDMNTGQGSFIDFSLNRCPICCQTVKNPTQRSLIFSENKYKIFVGFPFKENTMEIMGFSMRFKIPRDFCENLQIFCRFLNLL